MTAAGAIGIFRLLVTIPRLKRQEERKQENLQKKVCVKLKRSKQQKCNREEVFRERTDKSYGLGVGLTAGIPARRKENGSNGGEQNNKRAKHANVAAHHIKGLLTESVH